MYKIIGADQKEYGPVSSDELRQWILDGRVNAQTRVEIDGQWKTLGEIPEFAGQLAQRRPAPASYTPAPAPSGGSGMAVTSLVLGILSLFTCGILAPVGLILGILAMNKSKKNDGAGWGLALAGTIVSGCALLFLPISLAMFLPAFAKAKVRAQTISCVNNEKQISLAIRVYASEHNDQFPPAASWCDALKTELGSRPAVFQCAAANSSQPSHYGFNSKLEGREVSKVRGDTVMIFETEGGWNKSGGPELMLTHSRHLRSYNVAFVDGSVQTVTEMRLKTLRWDP